MIKLLHTADIHANKTRADDVVKLINIYIEEIDKQKIDAVLISGDFWDCAVVNNTEFAKVIAVMSKLITKVPVYMIYGTPAHEIANSLEVFSQMGANVTSVPKLWTFEKDNEKVDILGIPEPRRSDFITKSVEETDIKINEYLYSTLNIKHDNPLVVMWHGETDGCVMQNGVSSKSSTRLTKAMYSQCEPVYIAAGHIHCPQTVDKIVRYPGSPIPCNFGELHSPSYNLVTIDKTVSFTEIKLPFSQNRVVECDLDMFRRLEKLNFKGMRVKVKLSLPASERKVFKIKDECKQLKEATGADEVLINVHTEKEVSIRSREIIKTTSITDKLKIYSEVNNITLTDSIIKKAQNIEDSMLIKYIYPTHSFELVSLSLRGAKGVTDSKEVNINFKDYEDGVVALTGRNGSGKTTILENCSPYARLLTRSGSLRSHFYLKDSHRIVVYKDENGKYYRFTIQLAAHIDTGLVKYYAETSDDEGVTWIKVDGIDGNVDVYTKYVENLMGSVELYLRTAFFTKGKVKGVNDIASATKGERIALMSELLGTNTLTDIHKVIKEKLNDIGAEIDKYENIKEQKLQCEKDLENREVNEIRLTHELSETEDNLKKVEEDIIETRNAEEEYNKNYSKFGNIIQVKAEYEERVSDYTEHLNKLKDHKKQNDFYLDHKDKIEEYRVTYEKMEPVNKELHEVSKKLNDASSSLMEINGDYSSVKLKLEIEQGKYDSIDDRIKNAEQNVIAIMDTCPTCGAKLTEKKRKELMKANEYAQSEVDALKEFKASQKTIISNLKKDFTSIKTKRDKIEATEKELRIYYNELDSQYMSTSAYLDMYSEYKDYINYTPVTNLERDIEKVSSDLLKAEDLLKTLADVKIVDYKAKLNELECSRKELEEERLRKSMDIASLKTQIEQLQSTLELMKEQESIVKNLSKEYEEYSILEKAFSNGGIQALELEAAVPSIAEITNQILTDSYGDKFSVSFSTLKQGRDKILDDFSIEVTNNETGWTTPIELLSEGEKVWIVQSLQFAFSIVRMERTGFNFSVRFADESDGALDSEMRIKYFNMISSVHKSGKSRLTVLITHSQEIKNIASQSIQL